MSSPQWGPAPGQQPYGGAPVATYSPQPYAPPGYSPAPYGPQGFGGQPFGPTGFGGAPGGLPQYGPGPTVPQPSRRRSPLLPVLLGLIAVTVLAIAGLVVANMVSQPDEVAYQNDDYQVPPPDLNPAPLPQPRTLDEANAFLTNNPFYAQTAPIPVRCLSDPINVATATDEQLDAHFEGLMECLVRVWQPPVEAAKFVLPRPTVTIYGNEVQTKCGNSGVNAIYCGADQQVYYSNQLHRYVPIIAEDKWAADVVIAHEFGHALQGRTGIFASSFALRGNSQDKSEQLAVSRRTELQADCLAGMFVRAVSRSLSVQQSDLAGIQQTFDALGDEPGKVGDHGQGASRKFWGTTGLASSPVANCNTFVAPDSQVQ